MKNSLLLFSLFTCFGVCAQDQVVYLRKTEFNKKAEVYINNRLHFVVKEKGKKLKNVQISPDNSMISSVLIAEDSDQRKSVENCLKIYTLEGAEIDFLPEDVRVYKWSNDSRFLAILTGRYSENYFGYVFQNLFTYELKTKKKEMLEIEGGAYDFEWKPDNSGLLIKTGLKNVIEYDIESKSLKPSYLRGIHLSPDGRYYYQQSNPLVGNKFLVCSAKTNAPLKLNKKLNAIDKENLNLYGRLLGWNPHEKHSLLYKEKIEYVEYNEGVAREQPERKTKIVVRRYTKRDVIGINYKSFDVELNQEVDLIESKGGEDKLIHCPKQLLIQPTENGSIEAYQCN